MPITKHLIKGHKNPEAVINVVNYISNSSFLAEWGWMGIFMPTTEGICNEFSAVKHVMGKLADKLGKDLVILPSSIHEIIAVPYESALDLKNLLLMVQEVNKVEVAEEEQLSDRVYYFDCKEGVFLVDADGRIIRKRTMPMEGGKYR